MHRLTVALLLTSLLAASAGCSGRASNMAGTNPVSGTEAAKGLAPPPQMPPPPPPR